VKIAWPIVAGQFTALHELGPNDIPADAEQLRRLHLVAMTEFVRCARDCRFNLLIKVGTAIFKKR
jgi:aminoglycoside phosphotransferase